MSAVADAIEAASEEIMIADWWLSPESKRLIRFKLIRIWFFFNVKIF
jgi:hypothetical protein